MMKLRFVRRLSQAVTVNFRNGFLCRLGYHRRVFHHDDKGILGEWTCTICWHRHGAMALSKRKWAKWLTNDLVKILRRELLCRLGLHGQIITHDDKGIVVGSWTCMLCGYHHESAVPSN
jgi:hypothetical protein